MNRTQLRNQRGVCLTDLIIFAAVLALLVFVINKFYSDPGNRNSVRPAADMIGR
jgi:hypothetical protein